jgi:hypothetical protein
LASGDYPIDFEARSRLIKIKIRRKYSKMLETPDWSNEERQGLGYALQTSVGVWRRQKLIVQERLAWSPAAYLASIGKQNDFAPVDAAGNFTTLSKDELLRLLTLEAAE